MNKIIEWVYNHRWATTPQSLQALIGIAERELSNGIDPKIFHHTEETGINLDIDVHTEDTGLKKKSSIGVNGVKMEGSRNITLVGKTAILPVYSIIFPRANMFTRFSGATSLELLSKDFKFALDSPFVENIILNLDSPGGEITGVSEFAEMVYSARDDKRIITYGSGLMASAGYWIGSASSEIVVTDTAELGSIGVVAPFTDTSKKDEKNGIQKIEIVSSVSPKKRIDVKTDEGREEIQSIVDELAGIFVNAVAKHRGVSTEDVSNNFGQGGMLVAQSAINAGMADRISSLENLITGLNNKNSFKSTGGSQMLVSEATMADIKAKNPAVYNAILEEGSKVSVENKNKIKDDGFKAGQDFENKRIQEIESLETSETANIVAEYKFNTELSKEDVALKILETQKKETTDMINNIKSDAQELASGKNNVQNLDNSDGDDHEKRSEIAGFIVKGMNDRRKQGRVSANESLV